MEARRKKRAIDAVTPNFADVVIKNDKEDVIGRLLRGECKMTPEEADEFDRQCEEEDKQCFFKEKKELQTGYWPSGRKINPVQINNIWKRYKESLKFLIERDHIEWLDEFDISNFRYIADDEKQFFMDIRAMVKSGCYSDGDKIDSDKLAHMRKRYDYMVKIIMKTEFIDWLDEWDERNIKNV